MAQVSDCKRDWLWVRSSLVEMTNLYCYFFVVLLRLSAALNSVTQYALPLEFCGKLGKEYLNTSITLPTLLYAGYNVNLIM